MSRGERLRRAAAQSWPAAEQRQRDASGRWPSRTSKRPATCSVRSGTAGRGRDGYVSLEVDPGLAYDTLATFREAIRLHKAVDRPNLMVKIPATKPGLAAIEDVIAEGPLDQRHADLLAAALRRGGRVLHARDRAADRRGRGSRARWPRWRASSSRGSTPRPTGAWMRSAATTSSRASSRSPTRSSPTPLPRAFAGARWEYLAGKGATPQRVLWASTSTKNPAYQDTLYVEELIGAGHGQHDARGDDPRPTRTTASRHAAAAERGWTRRTRLLDELAARGRRLRRPHRDARARGRGEILGLLRRAARARWPSKRGSLAPPDRRAQPATLGVLRCRGSGSARSIFSGPRRERRGVERVHAEGAPAIVIGAAGGNRRPAVRAEAVLDQRGPASSCT